MRCAVLGAYRGGFAIHIEGVRGRELHTERSLHRLNARFQRRILTMSGRVSFVDHPQQIELPSLFGRSQSLVANVRDHFLRIEIRMIDVRALILGQQERTVPQFREADGTPRTKNNIARVP